MKILITGICGFVGSTLAKTWLEAEPGLILYGLDNFIRQFALADAYDLTQQTAGFSHGEKVLLHHLRLVDR